MLTLTLAYILGGRTLHKNTHDDNMYFDHLSLWISNKVFLRFYTATYTLCNAIILISKTVLQYGNGFPVKGLVDIVKTCEHRPWPLTVIPQSGDHHWMPC